MSTKFQETLGTYLPSLIVRQLKSSVRAGGPIQVPRREHLTAVCMFADISGFTKLSERLDGEGIATHLNSYFSQMSRIIASEGGDIFKFAGDAMIVLWDVSGASGSVGSSAGGEAVASEIETQARRAAQCACALQAHMHEAKLGEDVTLSMTVGIGYGQVSVLHIGGKLDRHEYLAVGEPLVQAFQAESMAAKGQVIVSAEAWREANRSGPNFTALHTHAQGFVTMSLEVEAPLQKRSKVAQRLLEDEELAAAFDKDALLEEKLKSYVPGALFPTLSPDSPDTESWSSELRRLSVLFVNLGLKEHDLLAAVQYDDAMHRVHQALREVQAAVYHYEGSVNKFLMDDKGGTLVAAFGLTPFSHENDATRAVLSALLISERLFELGLVASVGITTGTKIFCGVVGSKTRHEYTVLGDSVNMAARLMSHTLKSSHGGILCDRVTQRLAMSNGLLFEAREPISVKGKTVKLEVFEPYDRATIAARVPPAPGAHNAMRVAHRKQLRVYAGDCVLKTRLARVALGGDTSQMSVTSDRRKRSRVMSLESKKRMSTMAGITPHGGGSNHSSHGGHDSGGGSGGGGGGGGGGGSGDTPSVVESGSALGTNVDVNYATQREELEQQLRQPIVTVIVNVPERCKLSMVCPDSPQLPPIAVARLADTSALVRHALDSAVAEGLLRAEDARDAYEFELNVCGTRCFVPRGPPASAIDMKWLPHFVAEAGVPPPEQGPIELELNLVRRRDMAGVTSDACQLRFKLLERKIALIEDSVGGSVLVEGEVGSGKTRALARFVALTLPSTATLFCTMGSPFARTALFSVWWVVLQQLVTTTQLSADAVQRGVAALDCDVAPYLCLANGRIGPPATIQFAETSVASVLPPAECRQWTGRVIVALLRTLARELRTVVIIDDALYVDEASWEVALAIASGMPFGAAHDTVQQGSALEAHGAPPLLLIMATRPLRNYVDPFVLQHVPEAFHELCRVSDHMKLRGLKEEEVDALVCETLGPNVTSVSGGLRRLIAGAQGNPLMVKERVLALMNSAERRLVFKPLEQDAEAGGTALVATPDSIGTEELRCSLVKGFNAEDDVGAVPSAFATMGTRIDRLNSCQKMILKTASLIGHEFVYEFLKDVYPIAGHQHRLHCELRELEQLGFISAVDDEGSGPRYMGVQAHSSNATGRQGPALNTTFAFTLGCTRDVVRQYMLEKQQYIIREKIKVAIAAQNQAQRKRFMERFEALGQEPQNVCSYLMIRRRDRDNTAGILKGRFKRSVQGDWKRRWVELGADSFAMFREEGDETWTQKVYLVKASAELEPEETFDLAHVIKVSARSFDKHDHQLAERREFYLQAENAHDAERWVYMMKYVIERLEHDSRQEAASARSRRSADETGDTRQPELGAGTAVLSAELAASSPACALHASGTVFASDSRLLVTVEHVQVHGLRTSHQYQQLYATLTLNHEERRTTQSALSSAAADAMLRWHEDFAFDVPRKAWADGVLSVTLWNRDVLLSDEVLGRVAVRLAELDRELVGAPQPEAAATSTRYEMVASPALQRDKISFAISLATTFLQKPASSSVRSMIESGKVSGQLQDPAAAGNMSHPVSLTQAEARSAGRAVEVGVATAASVADTVLQRVQEAGSGAAPGTVVLNRRWLLAELAKLAAITVAVNGRSGEDTAEGSAATGAMAARQRQRSASAVAVLASSKRRPSMASAEELNEENQRWLASEYTRDSSESLATGFSSPHVAQEAVEFYYLDETQTPNGPFTPTVIRAWLDAGFMHSQVMIRQGIAGRFRRLDTYSALMRQHNAGEDASIPTLADAAILDWNFNIWQLPREELPKLAGSLLTELDIPKNFETLFLFFKKFGGDQFFTRLEEFAMLIAALCHDLEHPGLSNAYQDAAQTSLALRYVACVSTLESHHCACAFAIMRRAGSNVLAALDEEQFKQVRKLVVSCILATDMTTHFTLKAQLEEKSIEELKQQNELLAQALVHAADISNPTKPFEISKRWSDKLLVEFFAQGDRCVRVALGRAAF
eukprot:g1500.t1